MNHDFTLDNRSTVLLVASSVILIVLVFFAGFVTGLDWRPEPQMMAAHPAVVTPAAAPAPASAAASTPAPAPPAATAVAPVAADAKPAEAEAPKAAPAERAAAMPAASLPAAPAPASAAKSVDDGVRLAVQVGAFLEKENAEKLAGQLKQSGYSPQILLSGSGPRKWNIVRVGPYADWDQATQIAALLSRDQSTPAVIRPMR